MNYLGICYKQGIGTVIDFGKATIWFKKSAEKGNPKAWYNLGLLYKHGLGVEKNFTKAYNCFSQAADKKLLAGYYGKGYMLYKGLGCSQDYEKALTNFYNGANANDAACMYFLGLCMRNGYGRGIDIDSAAYWLKRSNTLGYSFAKDELASALPENVVAANILLTQAVNAQKMATEVNKPINKYTPIKTPITIKELNGDYEGYLVKYDYSGKHIIEANKLQLKLIENNDFISGEWIEEDTLFVKVKATYKNQKLFFMNMQYEKRDHYYSQRGLILNFDEASLQLLSKEDDVYLFGNIQQYSPTSKEPEKPMQLILLKTETTKPANEHLNLDNNSITVFPNPFLDVFNIQFEIAKDCKVVTQILTMEGKLVYTQPETFLLKGRYILPLQPKIASGSYIVRLTIGTSTKSTIIVKQ